MSPAPTLATQLTEAVYADLQMRHGLPAAQDTFSPDQTIIQRPYVDLTKLLKELKDRKLDGTNAALPKKLLIFCDVLKIGPNDEAPLLSNLRVFCAVLLPGALNLKEGDGISVYTGEAVARNYVSLWWPNGFGGGMHIDNVVFPGYAIRAGGRLERVNLNNFGTLREMPQTRACLERTYLHASLLHDENPALAIPLLRWVQLATASWPGDMQNLYLQASALLCSAGERTGAGSRVPWLAKEVYTRETSAFLAAAGRFEENYNLFRSEQNSLKQRATYARVMLRNYQDMDDVSSKLTAQAQANFDDADESVTFYTNQLQDQQLVAARAKVDLEAGIIRFQEEKKLEAGLAITGAAISLGMALGSFAMGVPDMQSLEIIRKTGKVANEVKQAAEAVEKIGKSAEKLKAIYETLKKIVAAAKKLKSIASMQPPVIDAAGAAKAETDDASWEIFRDKVIEMMAPAIENNIGGAAAYKLSLLALASYGKALNNGQAQSIAAGQEVARLLMQQAVNVRQTQRMSQYIDGMEKDQEPNEEMMRWLLERNSTVKRWLLLALSNYNDAFRYWALEEPSSRATLTQSIGELQEALANVVRAESGILQKFRPAPQPFRGSRVAVTDAQSLEAFRQNKRLSIEVKLDDRAFARNERVRVNEVRVWLEGVASAEPIQVFIASSGAYADRYKSRPFAFATSWPLVWAFQYEAGSRDIRMNAAFAEQFRAFYFEPTPFTTWTVSAPDSTLNLASLTGITLEFSGSAIARV